MPHLFRTHDGREWRPQRAIPVTTVDGAMVEAVWCGSVRIEDLPGWLNKPGYELAQTDEVASVAVRGEHSGKARWGDAPPGARLFFVLEPLQAEKDGLTQRSAKMVTTASTEAQMKYFADERFSLFGRFLPNGTIDEIEPLAPPSGPYDYLPPGELFEDPLVETYKDGVDKTLLKENLRLTPSQRLEKLASALRMVEGLRTAKVRKS